VNVRFLDTEERSLLALQGPKAWLALQELVKEDLTKMYFMETVKGVVDGVECRITRCGYTGEDGFEISVPSEKAVQVAEALLKNDGVKLAGLGARDTLRSVLH
jgi:aminomethyltransferase